MEDCDGDDFGYKTTCEAAGNFVTGEIGCNDDCSFDTSGCEGPPCGNGLREGKEACDPPDFGGRTCGQETKGELTGGRLSCAEDCLSYSTDTCGHPECGNGIRETGEACDGADLGSQTCQTQGAAGASGQKRRGRGIPARWDPRRAIGIFPRGDFDLMAPLRGKWNSLFI